MDINPKATFLALCGPAMKMNGIVHRRLRPPRDGVVKVQLGPGTQNYLDGWINIDANIITGKCDVWANARDPFPLRDNSADIIYSYHNVEHLPYGELGAHFREIYRCLKPGGAFRVGGPHGDNAMRQFVAGDAAWFAEFPEKTASIGGRLNEFLMQHGEHLTILTYAYLEGLARDAGFQDIRACKPVTETGYPQWIDAQVMAHEHESTPEIPHTLMIEGRKPTL